MTPERPVTQWGRCSRGRVWHLLDQAAGRTWCQSPEPIIEWTFDGPPLGGRPCPRCCSRVADVATAVDAAEANARHRWSPDPTLLAHVELDDDALIFRPVVTVDLLAGADEVRAAELRLRNEGPDPQADEHPEDGAA
ncbi:hypothetical protein GCM10009616_36170 [Microlunatus lacustris]